MQAAGLEDLTFHDLRHAFGTQLAASGADVVKIKELMGHASITTTMRAFHTSDKGKRDAIARTAERYAVEGCHKRRTAGGVTCRKLLITLVRPARLERATFWFVAKRSIQLSYGRV